MIATCSFCGQILQAGEVLVQIPDGATAQEQLGAKDIQSQWAFQDVALEVLKHMNQHHKQSAEVFELNQFFQMLGVTLASITAESHDSRYAAQRVASLDAVQRYLTAFREKIVPGSLPSPPTLPRR